jgi:hypothetical protein
MLTEKGGPRARKRWGIEPLNPLPYMLLCNSPLLGTRLAPRIRRPGWKGSEGKGARR